MKNNDVELLQRIIGGDEAAFTELVKKYQKQVHTLAWRKIGDFHIAEEITQDAFLKVYQKLHTLKNLNQFSGWLYVITTNLCATWLRKKRIQTEPFEDVTEPLEDEAVEAPALQTDAYSEYVVEEQTKIAGEAQREVVKKLLAKLKESERTVMMLHYYGEMTCEEISRFLGVSAGTIKSRLQRARQRLQKEETMIRAALEHFQISPNLTDNILQEVARLKPAAPPSKPLVPWAVATASTILIVLMLGMGSQYLTRFQQPYSLDAQTEMTVDIVDAPVLLNLVAKPDTRNQLGSSNALGKSDSSNQKPNPVLFAAAQAEGADVSVSKQQWIQAEPLTGSTVHSFLTTPAGEFYTLTNEGIYKLQTDGNTWQHIFDIWTLEHSGWAKSVLAKWNNTLYYTQSSDLFTSTDDGKTWNLLYSWDGDEYYYSIELILTDQAFFMVFENGVFRSEDIGKTWQEIGQGLTGRIWALVEVQNTLFAGTDNGFYRLDADNWKRLKFPVPIGYVTSIASTQEQLYILAELSGDVAHPRDVSKGLQRGWGIFRSSDLGNSWKDITPTNAWTVKGFIPEAKLIAAGETLLLMERGMVRSTDGGNTWMAPQMPEASPLMHSQNPAAVVNKDTIYIGSDDGLHRSIDGGESWDMMHIRQNEERGTLDNLIAFKETDKGQNTVPTLYAILGTSIVKTSDKGKSWKDVQVEIPMSEPHREDPPSISQIVKSDGVIYAKGNSEDSFGRLKTLLYRVSTDNNTLVPVQDMPFFDSAPLKEQLSEKLDEIRNVPFDLPDKSFVETLKEKSVGATQFFEQLAKSEPLQMDMYMQLGFRSGTFAVSDGTFYMEYNYKLFRWRRGYTEWYDTEQPDIIAPRNLKLAVSGNAVYVGKRDGHLVVSFDRGTNWIKLTPALPFSFTTFKEIVFAGSTVYVATDAGVTMSDSGKNWRTVTDAEGTNLIMEHLAVDDATVYGVTEKTGVYRLENGTWKQIVSEVPGGVTSLAVDGNTLYVGTENNGMLHYTPEKF